MAETGWGNLSDGFEGLQMSKEKLVGLEAWWADRGWLSVGYSARGAGAGAAGGGRGKVMVPATKTTFS